jgi:hypothetical protein
MKLCIDCYLDEWVGICDECLNYFCLNCLNCIAYGNGNLCENCSTNNLDEATSLEPETINDLIKVIYYIRNNNYYFEEWFNKNN